MFKTGKILFGKRGEGKTTELLKLLKDNDCLIVFNKNMARHYDSLMPYWIDVKVLSIGDNLRGYEFNNVYIDNADIIMRNDPAKLDWLMNDSGYNVALMTMSI
jgi:hypothetical protein